MAFKLSTKSLERRTGIDPRLIEIDDLALSISVIDFGHPADAGVRTANRQNELFQTGKSGCDGFDKISKHQEGLALDFYAFVNGRASWKTEHLAMVAAAYLQAASMLGYKLSWGGFFKPIKKQQGNDYKGGWDYPHVQLED